MYNYPLDYNWNYDELMTVMDFYILVEKAYEDGIESQKLQEGYKKFCSVVQSKSEQKQYDKAFYKESGYSLYKAYNESLKKDFVKL